MDWLTVVLRLVHIVGGALWVGVTFFNVFFLGPVFAEVGPAGGAVAAALQNRRIMTIMPIIAVLTMASGIWLMVRVYGGPPPMAINVGALVTLVAFSIGMIVARPAMMRAMTTTDPAEAQRLRARANVVGQLVAWMLLFALGAMAVARYV